MSDNYTLEELKIIFSGEQFRSKNLVALSSAMYVNELEAAVYNDPPPPPQPSNNNQQQQSKSKSKAKKSDRKQSNDAKASPGTNKNNKKNKTTKQNSLDDSNYNNNNSSPNSSSQSKPAKFTRSAKKLLCRHSESQVDTFSSGEKRAAKKAQLNKSGEMQPSMPKHNSESAGQLPLKENRANKSSIKVSMSSMALCNKQKNIFEPYVSHKEVEKGVADGSIIQGKFRINPGNYEDAFITDPVVFFFSFLIIFFSIISNYLDLKTKQKNRMAAATIISVDYRTEIAL